jgi:NAD-dependent deacetylase
LESLIERVARDLVESKYAICLTGAGVSTESGISDFRGPQGVWTKNPEAERMAYLAYPKFKKDPKSYWEERLSAQRSRSLWDRIGDIKPNPGHIALAKLEEMNILKFLITQNVDGLHERAGSKNLIEYHGSSLKLRCTNCISRFRRDEVDLNKLFRENKLPPLCSNCGGIIKGDTVSFGEPIPQDVYQNSVMEARKCDVMLVCGTSATVYPFAALPRIARQNMAKSIIEVNLEPTPLTNRVSDFIIQGKTGEILPRIVEEVRNQS